MDTNQDAVTCMEALVREPRDTISLAISHPEFLPAARRVILNQMSDFDLMNELQQRYHGKLGVTFIQGETVDVAWFFKQNNHYDAHALFFRFDGDGVLQSTEVDHGFTCIDDVFLKRVVFPSNLKGLLLPKSVFFLARKKEGIWYRSLQTRGGVFTNDDASLLYVRESCSTRQFIAFDLKAACLC